MLIPTCRQRSIPTRALRLPIPPGRGPRPAWRRPWPALAVAALVVVAGCNKHASDTVGPGTGPPPPGLVATQPTARATFVLYDAEIWGQFSRALDSKSVTKLTVFLKLDAQRVPITVRYEPVTRRILITPTVVLELQRTYTVEFSTNVHASDGTPLAPGVFFQFTTNSLRRVPYDYPVGGAVLEGPLVTMGWGATVTPVNNIFYELYASTDSVEVENRTVAPLERSVFTRFVPGQAWPLGSRVFWAITSENLTTHERLVGRTTSFRVLDASTPMDSIVIGARDHGSNDNRTRPFPSYCIRTTLPCGPNFNGSIHWDFSAFGPNAAFAGATMLLTVDDASLGTIGTASPAAWMAQNDWTACNVVAPGPPFNELSGLLATMTDTTATQALLTSDRLAAFCEAQYKGRTLIYGTLLRTNQNILFQSTLSTDVTKRPKLIIRYYRVPAPAPSQAAAATGGPGVTRVSTTGEERRPRHSGLDRRTARRL